MLLRSVCVACEMRVHFSSIAERVTRLCLTAWCWCRAGSCERRRRRPSDGHEQVHRQPQGALRREWQGQRHVWAGGRQG